MHHNGPFDNATKDIIKAVLIFSHCCQSPSFFIINSLKTKTKLWALMEHNQIFTSRFIT